MSFAKTYAESKAGFKPLSRKTPMRRTGIKSQPVSLSEGEKVSQKQCARKSKSLRRSPLKPKRISPQEREWRADVLKRADYRCQWPDCLIEGAENLDAHHINERSQRPDLRFDLQNGAAICPQHHDYLHHTVAGRNRAKHLGLLGGETYEAAMKRITYEVIQRREIQP